MPVPTRFGVSASGHGSGASFQAVTNYQPTGTSQAFSFSGMAAGNLALIYINNVGNSAPSTPSGWSLLLPATWTDFGYRVVVFWRVLTVGDIATGSVTVTSLDAGLQSTGWIIGYAGPTTATLTSTTSSATNASTLAISGFSKVVGCLAILFFVQDSDHPSSFAAPGGLGIVARLQYGAATAFTNGSYDILVPSTYTNGTGITFTGFATSTQQYGVVVQLS